MESTNIYEQDKGLALLDYQNYPEAIQEYMALEEAFLFKHLQGAKSLLEIGCGDGRYLKMLAPVVGEILGIDYAEYLVNVSSVTLEAVETLIFFMNKFAKQYSP